MAFIVALLLANQEIIPFFYSAIYDATIGRLPSDAATLRKLQLVSNTLLTIILIVVYLDVARSQTDQAVIQEEQAQIMEKQSEIMESHEEMMEAEFRPRVLVGQVDFEGNILRVDLSNVGRGAAVHLGLRLHLDVDSPQYEFQPVPEELERTVEEGRSGPQQSILPDDHDVTFACHPEVRKVAGPGARGLLTLSEALDELHSEGIDRVGIGLEIVYQDIIEREHTTTPTNVSFVLDDTQDWRAVRD